HGGEIGRVRAGDFSCALERDATFDPDSFNKKWSFGAPYSVTSPLRILKSDRSVKFSRQLAIGESAEFQIVLLVHHPGATDADRKWFASDRASAANIRAAALDHFRELISNDIGALAFPTNRWADMFVEAQISNQQLLVHFPGEIGMMPTQGGTSERFFV